MLSDYLKTFPQYVIPKQRLTTFAGFLANVKTPRIKNHIIKRFIQKYDVNMNEALDENPENYETFNAFFVRHLKPDSRPIASADIVSPVDGYISELGPIEKGTLFQAKGKYYSTQELLASAPNLCSKFDNGHFATLYLSPKDYHRVHMPLEATLKEMIYIPGKLFSVQPTTARVIPRLFSCNERLVVFFDTHIGLMAMVLVGATIVGAIGTSWHGDIARSPNRALFTYPQDKEPRALLKGSEMGYFKLGSTVILLFADREKLKWQKGLKSGDKIQFGESLGYFK